jgi:hypothetical protein
MHSFRLAANLVLMFVLLLSPISPVALYTATPVVASEADCPPRLPASDGDGRELSSAEKRDAFAAVITSEQAYLDYVYGLNSAFGQRNAPSREGSLLPVLLQSIAGIESDWTQFRTFEGISQTLRVYNLRSDTCDYGMMQINSQLAGLFARTGLSSLRAYTRANIAAGAQNLSEDWNNTGLPAINDQDPQRINNWYYTLSAYNSGPVAPNAADPSGAWENNPNCSRNNPDYGFCSDDADFSLSRPWVIAK